MANIISFVNNTTYTKESGFFKACTLKINYKLHSIELYVDIINAPSVCISIETLSRGKSILFVGGYLYRVILIDKVIHMRF